MASQPYLFRFSFARLEHLFSKSFVIACSIAGPRRPVGTLLPESKIVADDIDACRGERVRHSNQQRCISIRSGAMSENQYIQNDRLRPIDILGL
jgi:hypothetical protein